jgi:hypothetical protein
MEPLKEGDHGPYGTLSRRPLPSGLAILFMSALSALLSRAEQLKGYPLTEVQGLRIRDVAVAVITRADAAAATVEQRGYTEVDPTDAWASWQVVRGHTWSSGAGKARRIAQRRLILGRAVVTLPPVEPGRLPLG